MSSDHRAPRQHPGLCPWKVWQVFLLLWNNDSCFAEWHFSPYEYRFPCGLSHSLQFFAFLISYITLVFNKNNNNTKTVINNSKVFFYLKQVKGIKRVVFFIWPNVIMFFWYQILTSACDLIVFPTFHLTFLAFVILSNTSGWVKKSLS